LTRENLLSPDWLKTRIIVTLLAMAIPLYFFILVFFLPFQMALFGDPFWDTLFNYLITPLVFAAPWLGFILFERYRLANTVYLMETSTTSVPLRWRVFYGTNASFVLMFFILPVITAPLAIVGGLIVAARVFYIIGIGKFGEGKMATLLAIIVAIGLCIFPSLVMIQFIPNYVTVWESILSMWTSFWITVVYGIAQCLVNALSFGAPIYFIYFGAVQYEKGLYGEIYTKTPTNWIRFLEVLIFAIFLVLYLPPISTPFGVIPFLNQSELFTSYINWISLAIVAIMVLVKWRLKVTNDTTMGGASNIFVVGLFLVVELFFKTQVILITLIIWLAFFIFAALIIINYLRASPREMY
jgi:hypothetical protein